MTTLNATHARRALTRLAAPEAVAPVPSRAGWARSGRAWMRAAFPAPADSRRVRAILSTEVRADLAGVLDTAGLVAAAIGIVALLATLCR